MVTDKVYLCAKHGVELQGRQCSACKAESREAFTAFSASIANRNPSGGGGVIYGSIRSIPEQVQSGHEVMATSHGCGYLEYDNVPGDLQDEIEALIEEKIRAYEAICPCFDCRQRRGDV